MLEHATEARETLELRGQVQRREMMGTPSDPRFVLEETTVLFADVKGFTNLTARMGPLETFRFLDRLYATLEPAIVQHGGRVDKFIGEGNLMPTDRRSLFLALLPVILALATAPAAAADPVDFIVVGDTPYTDAEEVRLTGKVMPAIREADIPFIAFVGDLKAGKVPCTDELLRARRDLLGTLHPEGAVFYTPGDNERPGAGNSQQAPLKFEPDRAQLNRVDRPTLLLGWA